MTLHLRRFLAYENRRKKRNNFSCSFKSTNSPLSNDSKRIIKSQWHIIQSDPQLLNVFSDQPLSNLKDKLVHAETYISSPTTQGDFPCHNCTLITYKSTYVIYIIICPWSNYMLAKLHALRTRMIFNLTFLITLSLLSTLSWAWRGFCLIEEEREIRSCCIGRLSGSLN